MNPFLPFDKAYHTQSKRNSRFWKVIKKKMYQKKRSTHSYTCTHTHTSAVVVGEVVRARLFGNWRRGFRDGDVLQIEEAELHLHADECIQVAACQVAPHLSAQQRTQPICPNAVLLRKTHKTRSPQGPAPKARERWMLAHAAPSLTELTSYLLGATKFRVSSGS